MGGRTTNLSTTHKTYRRTHTKGKAKKGKGKGVPCATWASCATTRRHLRHKILHYLWMHLVSTTTEREGREVGGKKCHESMKYARYWYENRREERQMNYKLSTRRDENVERSEEREKVESERLLCCVVGNWEVYFKEIRWVIFSLF